MTLTSYSKKLIALFSGLIFTFCSESLNSNMDNTGINDKEFYINGKVTQYSPDGISFLNDAIVTIIIDSISYDTLTNLNGDFSFAVTKIPEILPLEISKQGFTKIDTILLRGIYEKIDSYF